MMAFDIQYLVSHGCGHSSGRHPVRIRCGIESNAQMASNSSAHGSEIIRASSPEPRLAFCLDLANNRSPEN